jgi:glutathione S-transferase
MSKLQIIGAAQSNFVWVTRIVAAEKRIDYELVAALPHTPVVQACHPVGKIPALQHGEIKLGESRAICAYLDRVFAGDSLIPSDLPGAALTEQWIAIVCTHVDPLLMRQYAGAYFFPKTGDGQPDRAIIDPILDAMRAQIAFLDAAVSASGHLYGNAFTLADAYLVPILYYLRQLPESQRMLASARHLQTYLDRHLQRPSVRATVPPPMSALKLLATG